MAVRKVNSVGRVRWLKRRHLMIGAPFAGEVVGFEEAGKGVWSVWIGAQRIGLVDDAKFNLGLIR